MRDDLCGASSSCYRLGVTLSRHHGVRIYTSPWHRRLASRRLPSFTRDVRARGRLGANMADPEPVILRDPHAGYVATPLEDPRPRAAIVWGGFTPAEFVSYSPHAHDWCDHTAVASVAADQATCARFFR